jgi:hypothetical protein
MPSLPLAPRAIIALVLLAGAAVADVPKQIETKLPEAIQTALRQTEAQLGPIDVSYDQRRELHLTAEELVQKLERPVWMAHVLSRDSEMRIVWQRGKLYWWRRMDASFAADPANPPDPQMEVFEFACDGRVTSAGTRAPTLPGDSSQGVLIKTLLSEEMKDRPEARFVDATYFEAAGIVLPTSVSDMQAKAPARSLILKLLEEGGKVTRIDQQKLTRIEVLAPNPERAAAQKIDLDKLAEELNDSAGTEEENQQNLDAVKKMRLLPERWKYVFELDPACNYAVVLTETRYQDGTLLSRSRCDDFEKLPGRELWLPHRCAIETFSMAPAPPLKAPITTVTIDAREWNIQATKDKQFFLDFREPGTTVADRTDPEHHIDYTIEPDGTTRPAGR